MHLTYEDCKRLKLTHLWPNPSSGPKLPDAPPPPTRFVEDGMNKTEKRCSRGLDDMAYRHQIKGWEFEAIKFRMADKTWFKPDFRVTLPNGLNVLLEVKVRKRDGSVLWKDDAAVKVKTIAELQPFPVFLAVWGNQRWDVTRLPSRNWGWINVDISWQF